MWSSWSESAKSSLTQALEKTGDAISRAATEAGKSSRVQNQSQQQQSQQPSQQQQQQQPKPGLALYQGLSGDEDLRSQQQQQQQQVLQPPPPPPPPGSELFKNLSLGWNSVIETTKASLLAAEEKGQQFLQEKLTKVRVAYYKRDPSLPLDVEALKDAEVVYITDRIITMGHPAMASQVDGEITGERKLAAIGHLLNRRHGGRFMVWNLSEIPYDVDILDDQVLTFSFPGSPSPPLGLLLKLLVSMESWLKADERNVAVVHCLTGKGRTSTVLAAFLCWMGEAGFSDIYDALEYIAACKQITTDELTIPSQRRYASYFKNMLDGVHLSQPPLMLKRIIMSEAPKYARGPLRKPKDKNGEPTPPTEEELNQMMGCVPYIQIFKGGKLLHTAPASLHFQQSENELPFCQVADGAISFHINQVIQGDILVRARHLTASKKRISMFRAAFHTGYVPPKVMRLTKSQLDGACIDDRFHPDFFLDLIFEPADAGEAGKLLQEVEDASSEHPHTTDETSNPNKKSSTGGTTGNLVTASAYDSMLHRDNRFWDVIAARKKQHDATQEPTDPAVGPTIGRRRVFNNKSAVGGTGKITTTRLDSDDAGTGALETFSIGGEFDFLPATIRPESQGAEAGTPKTDSAPPKKDSLMEALMGALDEDMSSSDHEVVVFDTNPEGNALLPDASLLVQGEEPKKPSSESESQKATDTQAPAATPVASTAGLISTDSSVAGTSSVDVASLTQQAEALNVDDDINALLGDSAGALNSGDNVDDLLNMDIDDAELEDLENFLSKS